MFRASVTQDDFRTEARLKIAKLANPEKLYKFWSADVAKAAKRSARSHSRGGPFWPSIAQAVHVASVGSGGASIVCDHVAGRQKELGGTIRAKTAGALTIPVTEAAKGKRAWEFAADLGVTLFAPRGGHSIGYSEEGKYVPVYALVQSVKQSPEPWWPRPEQVMAMGQKELDRMLQ